METNGDTLLGTEGIYYILHPQLAGATDFSVQLTGFAARLV
jgi:hypothetical protein